MADAPMQRPMGHGQGLAPCMLGRTAVTAVGTSPRDLPRTLLISSHGHKFVYVDEQALACLLGTASTASSGLAAARGQRADARHKCLQLPRLLIRLLSLAAARLQLELLDDRGVEV